MTCKAEVAVAHAQFQVHWVPSALLHSPVTPSCKVFWAVAEGERKNTSILTVSFSRAIFVTIQYMYNAASWSVLARLRAHSLLAEAVLFLHGRFHGILGPETRWEQTIPIKKNPILEWEYTENKLAHALSDQMRFSTRATSECFESRWGWR